MRRLNEYDDDYYKSLKILKKKCLRSGFDEKLVDGMIAKTKKWNREGKQIEEEKKERCKKLTWATEFPNILKLSKQEKSLMPQASITFFRPPTLGTQLLNYRRIAQGAKKEEHRASNECGACGLCGKRGSLKNMVRTSNKLETKKGIIKLNNKNLTCRSFGIYAGQCIICSEVYVGQTKTSFRTRWNGHRFKWNQLQLTGLNDQSRNDDQALYAHYRKYHLANVENGLELSQAFRVIFVEQPLLANLDCAESFWIGKVPATINVQKTFLPPIKSSYRGKKIEQ